MDSKIVSKLRSYTLPNNFYVTFMEILFLNILNLSIFLLSWFVVWPNPKLNDMFNNGFGPFRGFKCRSNAETATEEEAEYSGRLILIFSCISGLCLYFLSLIFCAFDHYFEEHGTLAHHRMYYPGRSKLKISWKLYRKAVSLAGRNGLCILFFVVPNMIIPMMELRGSCNQLLFENESNTELWTNILILIARFIVAVIAADIIFYVTHRICHSVTWMYQRIHKVHHQFVDTYAITATACHLVEHIFVNTLTVMGSSLISGLPLVPFLIFSCIGILNSTIAHAGYFDSHDYHHHFHDCEFGISGKGFADRLFGTQLKHAHSKVWEKMENVRKTQ